MPNRPKSVGSPSAAGHGASNGPRPPFGIHAGVTSPHGKRPLCRPRAANSHSASVGNRTGRPCCSDRHAQYATASIQLTPTTGRSARANEGCDQSQGSSCPVAFTKRSYSALVTGQIPISNPSTKTRCGGRSSSWPSSVPIVNQPPAMGANAGAGTDELESPAGWVCIGPLFRYAAPERSRVTEPLRSNP